METWMDCNAAFFKDIPRPFLRDTCRALVDSYEQAFNEVKRDFAWPECNYMLGHTRRCRFEAAWRSLCGQYEDAGISASSELNDSGNCSYTMVKRGTVVMTASKVGSEVELVRDAVFRSTIARSAQPYLIQEVSPTSEPVTTSHLYAILIHSPTEGSRRPAFAHVVFPSPDLREYLGRIKLEKMFPEIFDSTELIAPEQVIDNATPELLPDISVRARKSV